MIKEINKMEIKELINKVDNEFYKENNYYLSNTNSELFAETVAKIYAKYHVEKALLMASEKAELESISDYDIIVNKDSILKAYNLDEIK